MKKTVIIDYGMGNLGSVYRAVQTCGGNPLIARTPNEVVDPTHIILPGVGSFFDGMSHLKSMGFADKLKTLIHNDQIPFLGICLGMEVIASVGFEGGETPGFDWIKGQVKKFDPDNDERIPHVGWNEVEQAEKSFLFENIPDKSDFYFVHSYYFEIQNKNEVLGSTPYCQGFASAVKSGNVIGVQFHPEKSQAVGLQLLKNFVEWHG